MAYKEGSILDGVSGAAIAEGAKRWWMITQDMFLTGSPNADAGEYDANSFEAKWVRGANGVAVAAASGAAVLAVAPAATSSALAYAPQLTHATAVVTGTLTGVSATGPWVGMGAGAYTVYRGIDASGVVRYIGITSRNPLIRWAEHARSAWLGKANLRFQPIHTGLSRQGARVAEQFYITKNGGLRWTPKFGPVVKLCDYSGYSFGEHPKRPKPNESQT